MTDPLHLTDWRRRPLFWAAIFVSGVLALWRPDYLPAEDISRRISTAEPAVYLAGVVDSEIEHRESAYGAETVSFVLRAQKFWKDIEDPGGKVTGRVRVSMPAWPAGRRAGEEVRYGDLIALSGELREPRGLRNPGGFDQRAWLVRQGIRAVLYGGARDRVKILARDRGHPVTARVLAVKTACLERLARDFSPRDAAILSALFFGVRAEMDDRIKDRFLKTGTLHLLAVSGFNVGFVIAAVFVILLPLRLTRPLRLSLALAAAWFYVLLVGPQSPVFRAGVMASVWLLGEILGRRSDPLNSLGLSALILLAIRPLEIFDPGFQLSFAAVIGIVVAVPTLMPPSDLLPGEKRTWDERFTREGLLLFWTSAAAQAATLPVSVAHFYGVTPWAVFFNVPAGFLVFVIFMGGAAQMALSFALPVLAAPAAFAVHGLLSVLLGILSIGERLPGAFWVTGKLSLSVWLILAGAALTFIFSTRATTARRVGAFVLAAAVCFTLQEGIRRLDRTFQATFLDVGQGDAIHLRFPNGEHWLVDAGPAYGQDAGRAVLLPYFRHQGVRVLDRVWVTHPHQDHLGGLRSLLSEMRVRRYADPGTPFASAEYTQLKFALRVRRIPTAAAKAGETIAVTEDVRATVLEAGLPADSTDLNDASLILRIDHPAGALLLTGDAGEAGLARLLANHPKQRAVVLKVPHHGSRPGPFQEALVAMLGPSASIISAGERNRYGHPAAETLALLESVPGNHVYRTDRSGAVRAVWDKDVHILDGPKAFA